MEAASTKAAVTVGGNAPLTSGKETGNISAPRDVREVKNWNPINLAKFDSRRQGQISVVT